MENTIKEIPKIQQQPKQATETAIHYGYIAFKDINLSGPLGLEYNVQPPTSPYRTLLPCRELLPFTNVVYAEIDEQMAATTAFTGRPLPMTQKQKNARQCVEELVAAYEEWGFVSLNVLTGYTEEDAFHIFQTIQPFTYKLGDILDAVEYGSEDRIKEVQPYAVQYQGQSFTLQPLPADLKDLARQVRDLMLRSIEVAVAKGEDTRERTVQSMTQYFSTGEGKRRADPLDNYIFDQFNQEVPKLIGNKDSSSDNSTGVLEKLAEVILGKQKNEQLEQELTELRKLKGELEAVMPKPEPATIEASPKPISVGDKVTVGGVKAVVTAKPFGKVKVQFEDGSSRTVPKDEIG
jgi:hypothetical protein